MIVKVKFNYIAIYIMHVQCRYITTEHIGTTCVHFYHIAHMSYLSINEYESVSVRVFVLCGMMCVRVCV